MAVKMLAVSVIFLFSVRLILLVVAHLRPGGIDPIRDAVSDYARASAPTTRTVAAAASWAAAVGWALLGVGLLIDGEVALGWQLVALAVVVGAIPLVPTDGPGVSMTMRGRLHLLMAIVWFALAYRTIEPLSRVVGGDLPARILSALATVAALALVALVVSRVLPPLRSRTFGLSERVFVLVVTVVPIVAAAGLGNR
ncbi:DUF998 domain-containing protein [Gordonia sp. ABSL1-1]|uniref:DUF998 domain-containing protein n=1 Tax=Gordonia sp. ABSL1-1 TaxID=3053923 RepID=UPI0025729998|nr:DUF998 domain-containing protein [Gordonia sp. ABSL1-1]MDL9937691.1 DUF998 domain-containing protein [Gordonia sp. ABSL1-1]